MHPGERVTWIWKPRGGYGYEIPCRAEVIRITNKRVVIRVWRVVNGQEMPEEKTVNPESIISKPLAALAQAPATK